jgi:hypothetical protein
VMPVLAMTPREGPASSLVSQHNTSNSPTLGNTQITL